ncbi:MAG: metallophosphoesterase, partial [Paraprevotella sp.]|nr:metallophosphoesterase [Paraprevotella sp.]
MVLRILPVLLVTLILSDVYLYFRFIHKRRRPRWTQVLFFLPNVALLLAALLLTLTESHTPENRHQMVVFFSAYMLIVLPKIVFLIADLIGKIVCLLFPRARKICTVISSVAAVLMLGIMVSGLSFGPTFLQVRHTDFSSPDLPVAFDGYRIVQLSDLHLTTFRNRPGMVEKVVERVQEQHPDMIVFTGDLVSTDVSEIDGFDEILSHLKAPDGMYSVLGNHDYLTYAYYLSPKEQAAQRKVLIDRQRKMGWDLLLNEHRIIRRGPDSL